MFWQGHENRNQMAWIGKQCFGSTSRRRWFVSGPSVLFVWDHWQNRLIGMRNDLGLELLLLSSQIKYKLTKEMLFNISWLYNSIPKGAVCSQMLWHYPLSSIYFFLSKCPLNTIFYIPMVKDLKKKNENFHNFFADFKFFLVFSRFYPYKMGNYQWIFDFSIGEALYRSLLISWINLGKIFKNKVVALKWKLLNFA